jgi:hypothetical protein
VSHGHSHGNDLSIRRIEEQRCRSPMWWGEAEAEREGVGCEGWGRQEEEAEAAAPHIVVN